MANERETGGFQVMKKTVVVILSLMIVSVLGAMGAIIALDAAQEPEPQPYVWADAKGRFSAGYLPGWDVMNSQQAREFLSNSAGTGKAAVREQTDLMLSWINAGDAVMFISPDRASSVIISCSTMNMNLSDEYVHNRRNAYVQEVERVYRNIDAGTETNQVLPQSGNRISGVRCDNQHPSNWLLDLEHPNSDVYFTWKGANLYTIVISDAHVMHNDAVHNHLFSTLNLK